MIREIAEIQSAKKPCRFKVPWNLVKNYHVDVLVHQSLHNHDELHKRVSKLQRFELNFETFTATKRKILWKFFLFFSDVFHVKKTVVILLAKLYCIYLPYFPALQRIKKTETLKEKFENYMCVILYLKVNNFALKKFKWQKCPLYWFFFLNVRQAVHPILLSKNYYSSSLLIFNVLNIP